MGGLAIRPVAVDEADALARLTVDAYVAVLGPLPDDYLAELTDVRGRAREALVLVAVDDHPPVPTVVGGITYLHRPGPLATIDRPDQAELRMLAVAPEAQGRGIGTALVGACLEQARRDGKREVALHTVRAMARAQRLYERVGFRRRPDRDLVLEGEFVLLGYALDLEG